jgi:spore coat polysaccharide biosynthesis protein SpsF
MIQVVMEALKRLPVDCHILACPEDSVTAFTPLAAAAGFELISGPKDDVLRRYCLAIRQIAAIRGCAVDWVIRATGDNPFVFTDAAAALLREARARGADYAGYSALPYGAGVEVIKARALLQAEKEAAMDAEREHVCPFLYNHPELFLLHRPPAPLSWRGPDIRLTVDTPEDYERSRILYDALVSYPPEKRGNGETVISVFRNSVHEGGGK